MHLIDHYKFQVAVEPGHLRAVVDEVRLQRLRRDEQNAAGVASQRLLVRRRNIAMPAVHWDFEPLTQAVKSAELVVNERFKRTDVDGADRVVHAVRKPRNYREEGRLSFAARRGGTYQSMAIAFKQCVDCLRLNRPQLPPAHLPNGTLHTGM